MVETVEPLGNDISFFVTIDILGSGKREGLVFIIRKGKEKKRERWSLVPNLDRIRRTEFVP